MRQKTGTFLILFFIFNSLISYSAAFKYLITVHTTTRAHYNVGFALAKGLAEAGHEVTLATTFPLEAPIEGITHLPILVKAREFRESKVIYFVTQPLIEHFTTFHQFGLKLTKMLLNAPSIQNLMQTNQTFDAVICQIFLNDAHFGFAEHFNATLIGLSTFGATTWSTDMVGTPSPSSYVPHMLLDYSDQMSLWQRVCNFLFLILERLILESYYFPKQETIYRKYFPNNIKPLEEVRRSAALVLLNHHVSYSFPRPYSPNMIEVGGMHINATRTPLPRDLEEFMNGAEHGVIYFSVGSNLHSKYLPLEMRQKILNTFRTLKQRVLWKFEDVHLLEKPANVFTSDWFPQQDILAHEKVLAFLTHGGLLSIQESIYFGKPIIGMPIFGDQFMNMQLAKKHGYGLSINFKDFTAEQLKVAIENVIYDPQFTECARKVSRRFQDQMVSPLKRAVYWIEHVTKHKDDNYLRSSSQDLNFIQYHNLDAMLIVFGIILLINFIILLGIYYILRKLYCLRREYKVKKVKPK